MFLHTRRNVLQNCDAAVPTISQEGDVVFTILQCKEVCDSRGRISDGDTHYGSSTKCVIILHMEVQSVWLSSGGGLAARTFDVGLGLKLIICCVSVTLCYVNLMLYVCTMYNHLQCTLHTTHTVCSGCNRTAEAYPKRGC